MTTLSEYLDEAGRSPFGRWFARLDAQAAAKVATALYRLAEGNTSNTKSVGGGGSKRGQAEDISAARAAWLDYRRRRRAEANE